MPQAKDLIALRVETPVRKIEQHRLVGARSARDSSE